MEKYTTYMVSRVYHGKSGNVIRELIEVECKYIDDAMHLFDSYSAEELWNNAKKYSDLVDGHWYNKEMGYVLSEYSTELYDGEPIHNFVRDIAMSTYDGEKSSRVIL